MTDKCIVKNNFSVEETIFKSENSNFAVLQGSCKNKSFVAVGNLKGVDQGEILNLTGFFVLNKIYGKQFKVLKFKRALPNTKKNIIKFLSSKNIPGLNKKRAEKIVECFGEDSLNVLENNPKNLLKVKGIGKQLVEKISKNITNFLQLKKLTIFLEAYNISFNTIILVWNKWDVFSLKKIKNNPYLLCSKEIGVSFLVADLIAKKLNFEKNCKSRVFAAIEHVLLHNALENGHSCVPKKSLLEVVCSFLKLDENFVNSVILEKIKDSALFMYKTNKEFIFLPTYYFAEQFVAEKIINLKNLKDEIDEKSFENLLLLEEEKLKIKFFPSQKEAIKKAIENGIFILTGGPGTGKTTILTAVISILEQANLKVCACAPTAKAAKALEKIAKTKATTIHRLLGVVKINQFKNEFVHSKKNPLKEDVVVVDEMSMVDLLLFKNLLEALKPGCRLILSGDFNQLPCILAGNILKNLLASNVLECVFLTEIFRQAKKSLIITNAHNIINEKPLILNKKGKDFVFIEKNNIFEIKNTILNLISKTLPQRFNCSLEKDIQIICPCKKGIVGTIELNNSIQKILKQKTKKEFSFGLYTFKEQDKVLQIKNNYEIPWQKGEKKGEGIFNGEIGKILKINLKSQTFLVDFDGKIATFNFSMAKDLEPAWAITVHKSQGSEFLIVVMPIFSTGGEFFSRNLLYTALTRAKKLIILVGVKSCLEKMCKQKRVNFRYSLLKNFLLDFKNNTN